MYWIDLAVKDNHNAFEPVYASESAIEKSGYVGDLPDTFHLCGDELVVEEKHFKRREMIYEINEDGPGAWGVRLIIKKNTLFRWNPKENDNGHWYLTTADNSISLGTGGCSLETIELVDDDTLDWVLNVFVSA